MRVAIIRITRATVVVGVISVAVAARGRRVADPAQHLREGLGNPTRWLTYAATAPNHRHSH